MYVKHTSEIVAALRQLADRFEKLDTEMPAANCHVEVNVGLHRRAGDGFTNGQAMQFVDAVAEVCELGPAKADDVYYRPHPAGIGGGMPDITLWPLASKPVEVTPPFDPEI